MPRFSFSLRSLFLLCTVVAVAVYVFGMLSLPTLIKVAVYSYILAGVLMLLVQFNFAKGKPWEDDFRFYATRFFYSYGVAGLGMFMAGMANGMVQKLFGVSFDFFLALRIGAGLGFCLCFLFPRNFTPILER